MDPFNQVYFYGELIPPYIDVLGRGPHFRATNGLSAYLKYQTSNYGCYRNTQVYGVAVWFGVVYDAIE